MKISNKIFENKQYFSTLGKVHHGDKLAVMDAYRINRLIKKLDDLNKEYSGLKQTVIDKFGVPGKEQDEFTIEESQRGQFLEEMNDLLNIEHDLETEILPWPKNLEDGLSPADLGIMEHFFDMEKFQKPKINVNTGEIPEIQ